MYINEIINKLTEFWEKYNVVSIPTYDMEMGAATFHPLCFFETLKNKPFAYSYLQPSRRHMDGKYGMSPTRVFKHNQFQVLINSNFILDKENPKNTLKIIKDLYIKSLEYIGISEINNDIQFIENNWESTTLGAFGVGWEVWVNGMEITQFTFFTKMADVELENTVVELAYGIDRVGLMLNHYKSFYNLYWNKDVSYKQLFQEYERQMTIYCLDLLKEDINSLKKIENDFIIARDNNLYYPMYEIILIYNKQINLLLAGRVINQVQRKEFIKKIRNMVNECGICFLNYLSE
jgi:glycyl-tRNA synthetase alpha chain